MVTFKQTELGYEVSLNIKPEGFWGAFVPEGLIVNVAHEKEGNIKEPLRVSLADSILTIGIEKKSIEYLGLYKTLISYSLKDAQYPKGVMKVDISEPVLRATRYEGTSLLGGGYLGQAVVVDAVSADVEKSITSESSATLDLTALTEQEIEALKQALGIGDGSTQGVDLSSLTEEQIRTLKEILGVSAIETELEGLSNLLAEV